MGKKAFDSKKFVKNNNFMSIMLLLFGILAIASIFCGILVEQALPKELNGTYYGYNSEECSFYSLTIDGKSFTLKINNGIGKEIISSGSTKYVSSMEVPKIVRVEEEFEEIYDNAIVLKDENDEYRVLYIDERSSSNTRFMFYPSRTYLKDVAVSFEEAVNDPKNYYGNEYKLNDENKVVLGNDGKAEWLYNNSSKTYNYKYVNAKWLQVHMSGTHSNNAFLLYQENSSNAYVFEIYGNTIKNGENVYECTNATNSGNGGSGNGGSGNNNTSTSVDPQDYYGTYYSDDHYNYVTYNIQSNVLTITISTGNSAYDSFLESLSGVGLTQTCQYKYMSKAETASKFGATANGRACLVTKDTEVPLLWVRTSYPYTFTYEDGSNKSHTVDLQGGSLEDSTNDPKNYYKRYETSSYYTDYVRFYSDGTAEYHEYGGSYDQYEFMYVNRGWLEAYGLYDSYSYDKALVLFNDENIMVFEYINSNTLEDENGTRFTY